MAAVQPVLPIARGYHYAFQLHVDGDPMFPAGCTLRAELRDFAGAAQLAGVLTDAGGQLVRIDDNTLELHIPALATARLTATTAMIDVVRTDLVPEEWLGIQVTLPVIVPVTVPSSAA